MKNVPGLGRLELVATLTLSLVFGVIAGILGLVLWYSGASGISGVALALGFSVALILVQWYIGPSLIRMLTRMKEMAAGEYPQIHAAVERLAREAGIPKPKLYVVYDGSPNAFAFGRTQASSGIAVHTGLLNALDEREVEGVLAHEIGHIKHRDVVVMTIASVLPVLLYYLVIIFAPRDRDRGAGSAMLVFFGAMIAQFLGRLLVMWLSRKREYYADAFSAYVTQSPRSLMSGLAKITYGAARAQPSEQADAMRAFYIADPKQHEDLRGVAQLISRGSSEQLEAAIKEERKRGAMQFFMTHPLTANRLLALARIEKEIGG